MSTAEQLAGTLARHYAGRSDLVVLTVALERLPAASVRWEPAKALKPYPHLYAELPRSAVIAVEPLPLDELGVHRLPEAIERALRRSSDAGEPAVQTIDVLVRWNDEGFAELEYPQRTRIEDEATIYAWEALLDRRLSAIVEARGEKVPIVVRLDNLWVSPKLERRYVELADKIVSRWVTKLARWGSREPITNFIARANEQRDLPSNVFASRDAAIEFVLGRR